MKGECQTQGGRRRGWAWRACALLAGLVTSVGALSTVAARAATSEPAGSPCPTPSTVDPTASTYPELAGSWPAASVAVDSTSSAIPNQGACAIVNDDSTGNTWTSADPATSATPAWVELNLAGGTHPIATVSAQIPPTLGYYVNPALDDPSNEAYGYTATSLDAVVIDGGTPVATQVVATNTSSSAVFRFDPPVSGDAVRIDITGASLNGVPGQPGQLAQVTVYGPSSAGPTPATSADGFANSTGINVFPLSQPQAAYFTQPFPNGEPSVYQQLVASGIRHIRTEVTSADPTLLKDIAALGNAGIRTDMLVEGQEYGNTGGVEPDSSGCPASLPNCPTVTQVLDQIESDQVADAQSRGIPEGPFAVDVVEGVNEPDTPAVFPYKTYTYPKSVVVFDQDLYKVVHASTDPNIAAIKVAPSAWGNPYDTAIVGDLAPYCDYATLHTYPYPGIPDRFLDGPNHQASPKPYGRLGAVDGYCSGKPVLITESGYNYGSYSDGAGFTNGGEYTDETPPLCSSLGLSTPPCPVPSIYPEDESTLDQAGLDGCCIEQIPEAAGAKYIPRLVFEHYIRNVARTYIFQMLDTNQGAFGLLRADGTQRPAYHSLQNLISVLSDPGPGFTPGSLNYTITGGDPYTLRHTLLQKRNGDFYLALWSDVPSISYAGGPTGATQTISSSQPVTLSFNQPVANASVYQPDASTLPSASYIAPTKISLDVPDQITLVRVTPGVTLGPSGGPTCTPSADSVELTNGPGVFGPGRAFDGNPATSWQSAETPGDHWVQCGFNFTRTVDQVSVLGPDSSQNGGQTYRLTDFDVSTQLGNGAFVVQKAVTNNTYQQVTVSFAPVQADVVRITVHSSTLDGAPDPTSAMVSEVGISPAALTLAAPTVSPEPSVVGSPAAASASFSGGLAPYSCSVDYGDGTGLEPGTVSGGTCAGPAHTYASAATYVVSVVVGDAGGADVRSAGDHAVGAAPAPTYTPSVSTPTVSVGAHRQATAQAPFSDAGGATDAPFTCAVDYGDGSGSQPGVVSSSGGSGTCSGPTHTYATKGSYTVTVSVTNAEANTGFSSTALMVK